MTDEDKRVLYECTCAIIDAIEASKPSILAKTLKIKEKLHKSIRR